jgi:hypothetical protein
VIRVIVDPNLYKQIEVPVSVVGEVSGTVFLNNSNDLKGLGRIIVNILNKDSECVAKLLTEGDGYFSYVGLIPGNYTAILETSQLEKLNLQSTSPIPFSIISNVDGDVISDLRFVLQKK